MHETTSGSIGSLFLCSPGVDFTHVDHHTVGCPKNVDSARYAHIKLLRAVLILAIAGIDATPSHSGTHKTIFCNPKGRIFEYRGVLDNTHDRLVHLWWWSIQRVVKLTAWICFAIQSKDRCSPFDVCSSNAALLICGARVRSTPIILDTRLKIILELHVFVASTLRPLS
jgi:hypothetical protein